MSGIAYYNEIDPYAAEWLRNLIAAGHIAPGIVDERDIQDVRPEELTGYTQCHFFAGIGVWSYALRLAGWPDNEPVWTGSCPCQPFSAAGKGAGFADERHLWPAWFHLIEQHRPPVVFGEQVASKDGLAWLDLVHADLEGAGYAVGAADLCAAGIGAPHIRQRLWFVGERLDYAAGARCDGALERAEREARNETRLRMLSERGAAGRLGHHHHQGLPVRERQELRGEGRREEGRAVVQSGGASGGVEHALYVGRERRQEASPGHVDDWAAPERSQGQHGLSLAGAHRVHAHAAGTTNGFWRAADWLLCRDGKWRPVEPGTFPLAHGAPARVGRLRAYGNAIVAEVAKEFIGSYVAARREIPFVNAVTP